ncbi:MAG: peptide chain release factor N(5)-glutamine methyltransferase [Methyloglobulus sp.]|nr:peptide chain release factor N(5)-glutamine methyltransferase [Methyloglobulus sp.]
MTSIKTVLKNAAESLQTLSESAFLDAEILLCTAIDKDRSYLRAWPDQPLNPDQIETYEALLAERRQGKPIAYITGHKEFWSRDFLVSPDVLIPRPDTELLVELSLALIPKNQPTKIIDLGTGSGIIAITLATECPYAQIIATDMSEAALHIAKRNAMNHKVDNIQFFQSNWFEKVPAGKVDLIVSNPPYIAAYDPHLQDGDLRFEPITALVAVQEGLSDICIIAENARDWLENGGFLLIEHGYNQEHGIQAIFTKLGYDHIQTHRDLSGQPRVTSGQYLALA